MTKSETNNEHKSKEFVFRQCAYCHGRMMKAGRITSWATATAIAMGLAHGSERHYYFPESQLVLDMATLSQAVYHLRNKVTSCREHHHEDEDVINHKNYSKEDNRNNEDEPYGDIFQRLLPVGSKCLYYSHDYSLGTQVLVVRSELWNYVAVAYSGTDDWRTALTDGDILMSDFGPTVADNKTNGNNTNTSMNNTSDDSNSIFKNVPEGIRVHRGFNEAVFDSNIFPDLLRCIASARVGGLCCNDDNDDDDEENGRNCLEDDEAIKISNASLPAQIFTTGHSLGAADSVLLGAALHLAYPDENITCINFGGPKIGNIAWSFWMNSMQHDKRRKMRHNISSFGSFEIFRFVNKIDLVPRLPELPPLTHAGHTLQMSVGGSIKAYYDHFGDEDEGYAGIPFGWEEAPYALLPLAVASHPCYHYVEYLDYYKPNSTSSNLTSYVEAFERTANFRQGVSFSALS